MMTTLLIFAGVVGLSTGMILGFLLGARHVELECETAYLTGHVDGYGKAMDDSGEVWA